MKFLSAGDAVYLGWGSMTPGGPERMTFLAVRALQLAGLRGIVLGGWAGLKSEYLECQLHSTELLAYAENNVLFVASAPHEWLFPKCKAIVHHGGAGTTAAAMRSGVPAIITPVLFDQFNNAHLTESCGVGLGLQQFNKVTPEALAGALRRAVTDQGMKQRAAALGAQLRAEDGCTVAVGAIEKYLQEEVYSGLWKRKAEVRTRQLREIHEKERSFTYNFFSCFMWLPRIFVREGSLDFGGQILLESPHLPLLLGPRGDSHHHNEKLKSK